MALMLPSTVEELNYLQNSLELNAVSSSNMYVKGPNKDFDNIAVERRYKREVSLPNGIENWNISNFDPYLNFDDQIQPNTFEVIPGTQDDRLVPEGVLRQRCESFSSVSSSMDDKCLVYHNMGVKTYNTVRMDSGSTCISSDHTYVNPNSTTFKGLDAEETYQNLDTFLRRVPDVHPTETISSVSPVGSPMNDSNLDYSIASHSFSASSNCSQDSFPETPGLKRTASNFGINDELLLLSSSKRTCESSTASRYYENRKKNNAASKNCRKTRKEKQKEMEIRITELEKENEEWKEQVQVLEKLIRIHTAKLCAVIKK